MNKILLDTSVIIDFLRTQDKENTLLFTLLSRRYRLCVSIITHTELYAGRSVWDKDKKEARNELQTLLSGIQLFPLGRRVSKKAGEIRAKYGVNLLDAIIAASAIVWNIELVTLNTKDFEMIAGLRLLNGLQN